MTQIGEFRQLARAGIHDSRVVAFSMSDQDVFSIELVGVDGLRQTVDFADAIDVGFHHFKNNAIVDDIFCWPLKLQVSTFELQDAFATLVGESYVERNFEADFGRLQCSYPSYLLVKISCSYGGDVAILCTAVEFGPRTGGP